MAGRLPGSRAPDYPDTLSVDQRRKVWASWPRRHGLARARLWPKATAVVVGFVNLCPTRDEDRDPSSVGEITSIYVLAQAWGSGTVQALMAAALDRLTQAGFVHATVRALDTDDRARCPD